MKKTIGSFIPFLHDNFQFKRNVIDLARKQPQTFEGIHTATLIYVNAVDYIALHLLENLRYITYLVTNNELNDIIFFSNVKKDGIPLGKVMYELEKYEFPDKNDFMSGLTEFGKIRNKLVHNLLSLTPDEINKISDDFEEIKKLSEALLNRYDIMVKGMSSIWINYVNKLGQSGNIPINVAEEINNEVKNVEARNETVETKRDKNRS